MFFTFAEHFVGGAALYTGDERSVLSDTWPLTFELVVIYKTEDVIARLTDVKWDVTDVVRGFGEYSFQPDVIDLEDKSYTYDDVGNITQIAQDIRTSESILGGRYTTEYTYDTQNRLLTASQQSTSLGAYDYSMSYSLGNNIFCEYLSGINIIYTE